MSISRSWASLVGVLALMGATAASTGSAQTPAAGSARPPVTFTKDVAPIFQRSCQICHRPDSIAPMSLMTFEDARPWARAIRDRVARGQMPPFNVEANVGIQKFKNDRRLSASEIATITSWVDSGAARGNPADMPPPVQFADVGEWEFGEPDLIVQIPNAHFVPAQGPDEWANYVVETTLTEDRYLMAVQTRPGKGAHRVVHHVNADLLQQEDDAERLPGRLDDRAGGGTNGAGETFLNEYALGKGADILPEGTGKLVKAGSLVRFNIHYHPNGEAVRDRTAVGMKFYPKGYVPKYHQIAKQVGQSSGLDIPAGASEVRHDGYFRLRQSARITGIQAHQHNRGKRQCIEAILPDDRVVPLNCMRVDFAWHLVYLYADDVTPLLPAGTVLHVISWTDNSTANPHNPDPRNWVGSGNRTIDEMSFVWLTWTYLTDDDYGRMVEEQRARQTNNNQ